MSTYVPGNGNARYVGFGGHARNSIIPLSMYTATAGLVDQVLSPVPPDGAVAFMVSFTGSWRYTLDGVTNPNFTNRVGFQFTGGNTLPLAVGVSPKFSPGAIGNQITLQWFGTA